MLWIIRAFFALFIFLQVDAAEKQKICLNMIVKNESRVMVRCLESVKPLIDYWVIVDTGSTDGTQELIRKTMTGIPGELHEQPWKNFAHNRNQALQLAKGKGDYVLFIDADETFVYDPSFHFSKLEADCYNILIKNERSGVIVSEYVRTLLVNNHLDWKWEGVIHETINCPIATKPMLMQGIVNLSKTEEGARFQDPKKYLKDAQVLEAALKEDPSNLHYTHYLGISYLLAHELPQALKAFEKRVAMQPGVLGSGEIFTSLYCIGVIHSELKMPIEKVVDSLSKAYFYNPTRAEPLYQLGAYFIDQNQLLLADLVLRKAESIPMPQDSGIVENWIYDWGILHKLAECSFKMGQYHESEKMIRVLLSKPQVPQYLREALEGNLRVIQSF